MADKKFRVEGSPFRYDEAEARYAETIKRNKIINDYVDDLDRRVGGLEYDITFRGHSNRTTVDRVITTGASGTSRSSASVPVFVGNSKKKPLIKTFSDESLRPSRALRRDANPEDKLSSLFGKTKTGSRFSAGKILAGGEGFGESYLGDLPSAKVRALEARVRGLSRGQSALDLFGRSSIALYAADSIGAAVNSLVRKSAESRLYGGSDATIWRRSFDDAKGFVNDVGAGAVRSFAGGAINLIAALGYVSGGLSISPFSYLFSGGQTSVYAPGSKGSSAVMENFLNTISEYWLGESGRIDALRGYRNSVMDKSVKLHEAVRNAREQFLDFKGRTIDGLYKIGAGTYSQLEQWYHDKQYAFVKEAGSPYIDTPADVELRKRASLLAGQLYQRD